MNTKKINPGYIRKLIKEEQEKKEELHRCYNAIVNQTMILKESGDFDYTTFFFNAVSKLGEGMIMQVKANIAIYILDLVGLARTHRKASAAVGQVFAELDWMEIPSYFNNPPKCDILAEKIVSALFKVIVVFPVMNEIKQVFIPGSPISGLFQTSIQQALANMVEDKTIVGDYQVKISQEICNLDISNLAKGIGASMFGADFNFFSSAQEKGGDFISGLAGMVSGDQDVSKGPAAQQSTGQTPRQQSKSGRSQNRNLPDSAYDGF